MLDNDFIFKIVDLEINPFSTPKTAKRELKEILRKYEYDDDFIDNINDDIAIGYAVAIGIIKRVASEEIHKSKNTLENHSKQSEEALESDSLASPEL